MINQTSIKYKAWDIAMKKMFIPSELQFRAEGVFCYYETLNSEEYADMRTYYNKRKLCNPAPEFDRDQDAILLQYTGLKDKGGIEIYEGDILEADWQDDRYPIHTIGPVNRNEETGGWNLGEGGSPMRDARDYFRVIGNIYENPELIN